MSDVDRIGFLDLLAQCNIIDALDGLIHQTTGNWVRLEWERQENGPTGGDIERELDRLGVPICGRWFSPASEKHPYGTLSCLVPEKQARWAEHLLTVKGITFVSELIDAKSVAAAQRRQGEPIPAWSECGQYRTSIQLSEMNFAASRKEEKGPVQRVLDWLRDG